jgi:hypothetical protein
MSTAIKLRARVPVMTTQSVPPASRLPLFLSGNHDRHQYGDRNPHHHPKDYQHNQHLDNAKSKHKYLDFMHTAR